MQLKKGLLVVAFMTITVIGLVYGVSPQWFYETFLVNSQTPGIDQSHILRAVMMLYLGLGLFWLYCAFSGKYRDAGIIVLGVFCAGLVSGRILSVVVDGTPSPILILYIGMELALVPICIWLLKRDT
ncbi:DUF4345 domain-containing protein [Gammaproteobacteria bacterium]|nr:DUF4345 domain-containing protein [Gammaproteobacteria bacterium]